MNVLDVVINFFQSGLKGGYGAIITILKSWSLGKVILRQSGLIIGIPDFIVDIVASLLFFTILMAIVFLIFNRAGDSV